MPKNLPKNPARAEELIALHTEHGSMQADPGMGTFQPANESEKIRHEEKMVSSAFKFLITNEGIHSLI